MRRPRTAVLTTVLVVAAVAAGGALAACSSNGSDAETRTDGTSAGSTTTPTDARPVACDTEPSACATTGSDVTLEITGPPTAPISVEPPPGHPLSTIDRDAGISVRLSDGSLLWLFGDTAARAADGTVEYFIIGTGAWAAADAPTVTRDGTDPTTGEPVALAEPSPGFPPCPEPSQRQGMWPAAAVVDHVGDRDRVVIWLQNVCLGADIGAGPVLDDMGMAVAEWWYDPAAPPVDQPIRATVLTQQLFPATSYGVAAVRGEGDEVFAYRCAVPASGRGPAAEYGPCTVARTTLSGVADPTTYAPWDGRAFTPDAVPAPVELPAGALSPYPAGGFTVVHDPTVGAYVMAYTPWPSWTQVMELRVSPTPVGPWSTPVTVRLPGCDDRIAERTFTCYAATAQPAFSTAGQVGVGYYDSMISSFPTRGAYRVTTVPVTVSSS